MSKASMGSPQDSPQLLTKDYVQERTQEALQKFRRKFTFAGRRANVYGSMYRTQIRLET